MGEVEEGACKLFPVPGVISGGSRELVEIFTDDRDPISPLFL